MDILTLGAAVAVCKSIPGSAAERAETAAAAAEAAAESVETATVAETKTYLGIT